MNEKACYLISVFWTDTTISCCRYVPVHTVTLASVAYVARIRLHKLIDHARGLRVSLDTAMSVTFVRTRELSTLIAMNFLVKRLCICATKRWNKWWLRNSLRRGLHVEVCNRNRRRYIWHTLYIMLLTRMCVYEAHVVVARTSGIYIHMHV